MEKYKDIGGDSGVESYEIGDDYITVRFKGGKKDYTYTYATAGVENVETAKDLAKRGDGLNAHIKKKMNSLYVR